jgi:hypothetical protein
VGVTSHRREAANLTSLIFEPWFTEPDARSASVLVKKWQRHTWFTGPCAKCFEAAAIIEAFHS